MDANVNKIVALVAVGKGFIDEIIPYYNKLKEARYTVKVLTDKPSYFNAEDTVLYERSIFNYFDKVYFSLSLVKKYNQTVICIDGSLPISTTLIDKYTSRLNADFGYIDNWPLGGYNHYQDEANFKYLNVYLDLYQIPIKNYPTVQERVMIFGKNIDHELVTRKLEEIQPVFDYMAILNYKMYKEVHKKPFVLGDAEGLALSIVLNVNNIKLHKISKEN